ncbi:MAG: tetratricopeptide repeat protein [Candidatus Daviesbacteria bacterium]|nr:tetratricopeptide repeat protein [Candidatus Daviesbacteria bacterium]
MIFAQAIGKHRFSLLFLLILVLVAYGNSLNNAFLSDDLTEIVQNPNIGSFSNIFNRAFGFIRPFLYWLIFQIGGLNPALFRLSSIFFHLGSVFLIYALFNLLYSKRLGFFVASLFAVHPAISEAVVWISGGMYTQYAFFFLLSFVLYLLSKKRVFLYWLSVATYLFSLMSHPQMPLALFLIFPLFEVTFGSAAGGLKKNWPKMLPYLFISLFFALITLNALPERETTLRSVHYQQRGIDNPIAIVTIAVTSYLEMIFFPKTLTLYHSELAFSQIQFIIRLLITIALLAGTLISFKKNKFIFFWLSFFLIALSPTLTPLRLNWVVAERYLYLPIVGILALAGLWFDKLVSSAKFRQTGYILFAITIILFTSRTIVRNIDWRSEDNLWIATGKTSPSSPNAHNNLGDVYGRRGDKFTALQEFQKAIALKPDYGDAYHNLANTYKELNEPEKALENYQNALKYNPNLWQSYQNIGAVYFEQKKYDLALLNFQKAAQINPKNLSLQNAIGIIYLNMGDKDKAREIFKQLLNIDPDNQILKQELLETNK